METETIELPKQLLENIRKIVHSTKLFSDENDFINQAIIKHISKFEIGQ
jgi:Arc/MetJ-type ribon-helix-helix transcriptional regulator